MLNAVVAVALLFSACAVAVPLERRANGQVVTSCTVPKTVALTFDDGPYIWQKTVVDTLRQANAKGTFFMNGNNWRCIYEDDMVSNVKYAYAHGFQLASHTWAHEHLTNFTAAQVDSQMAQTEDAIRKITGAVPAYTRPPYGEYNDVTLQVAAKRNQILVNWDFDSKDSLDATVAQQKTLYDQLVADHPSTVLSLQHEVFNSSVFEVLPYAIKVLQKAGYKLVTLAECLNGKPYLSIGPPSAPDATWTC